MTTLHLRYRPRVWADVLGQDEIVASITSSVKEAINTSYLLTGPAGVGKTTMARLIAKDLKCDPINVMEIDAATYTGIDNVREILKLLQFQAFGKNPNRVIIVDECHALTKQAWQALLKVIEEPPPYVWWVLCTTDPDRVPPTIYSRCNVYKLSPVSEEILYVLLDQVNTSENFNVSGKVLGAIARNSEGSPRKALVNLGVCRNVTDSSEVSSLLHVGLSNKQELDFCRWLMKGDGLTWRRAMKLLDAMGEFKAENLRTIIVLYCASTLKNCKNDKESLFVLNLLECFNEPYLEREKLAPLYRSLGTLIYGAE